MFKVVKYAFIELFIYDLNLGVQIYVLIVYLLKF